MSKIAGMKEAVEKLATTKGITKNEAKEQIENVLDVIGNLCVEGGVSFRGKFTITKKLRKGKSGEVNGTKYSTEDKYVLKIKTGSDWEEILNAND